MDPGQRGGEIPTNFTLMGTQECLSGEAEEGEEDEVSEEGEEGEGKVATWDQEVGENSCEQ